MYFLMIVVGLMLVILVGVVFLLMSYKKLLDSETFSSYECGFNVSSLSRIFFSFRFFLISILFLVFDVEIVLLLPIPFLSFSMMNMFSIYFFLVVLIIGLVYEYYYGSLDWFSNSISKA